LQRDEPVQLFWTGGWDSTFRLLQLLLDLRLPVAPVYLVDETRVATQVEFDTMDRIRAALFETHPHTRDLLLPTHVSRVADIAPDARIDGGYARLACHYGMGNQYAWLARYCRQHALQGIELSAECALHGAGVMLQANIVPMIAPQGFPTFHIPADAPDADSALVFGAFGLPLVRTTRQQMLAQSQREGWMRLMRMTWFCHRPTRAGTPCGVCNPCLTSIKQGFGWRVSRPRRALGAVYRTTLLPLRKAARRIVLKMREARASRDKAQTMS
jgi:hypothetical protein